MPRARNTVASRRRRKRTLQRAKGYWGGRSKMIRTATEAVDKAGQYAYRDRRKKKGVMRSLWILRINAAAREHGWTYSQLVHQMTEKDIQLNRPVLAHLAAKDPEAFQAVIEACQDN